MKNTKKLIKWIISGIFALIVVLCGYFIISNTIRVSRNEIGSFFGYSVSYVPTESMEPVIDAGSTVIFKKTSYEDAKVGDIIVYYNDEVGIYVIHQIYDETDDGFIMKGVNNPTIDYKEDGTQLYVTKDNFYGTYVKTVNWLSLKSIAMHRGYIFALCVIIFMLAFVSEALSLYKTYQQEKRKEKYEEEKKIIIDELKKELAEELKNKSQEK